MDNPLPTSGRFGTIARTQYERIRTISKAAREHPDTYRSVLSADPEGWKDGLGNPYWGSTRHIIESALECLEREIERKVKRGSYTRKG